MSPAAAPQPPGARPTDAADEHGDCPGTRSRRCGAALIVLLPPPPPSTDGPPRAASCLVLIIYLGALVVLFVNAFWRLDLFTGRSCTNWGFANFQTLLDNDVYRTITLRTVGIAAAVT